MENTLTIILPDAVFERLQAEAIKTERSVSQLAADAVIAVYGPAPLRLNLLFTPAALKCWRKCKFTKSYIPNWCKIIWASTLPLRGSSGRP